MVVNRKNIFQLFIKKNFQRIKEELSSKLNLKKIVNKEIFKIAAQEYKLLSKEEKDILQQEIPKRKKELRFPKPLSGYQYFMKDQNEIYRGQKVYTHLRIKEIAKKWRELDPDLKKPYQLKSMNERIEYLKNKEKK